MFAVIDLNSPCNTKMKIILIATASIILPSACATDEALGHRRLAQYGLEILKEAHVTIKHEPDNLSEADKQKLSICSTNFFSEIKKDEHQLTSASDEEAKDKLTNLELALQECTSGIPGVKVVFETEYGSRYSISEYFSKFYEAQHALAAANHRVSAQRLGSVIVAGALVAAGAAAYSATKYPSTPSLTRVSGYYRKNGTYVSPHYRSTPNAFCWDNLNGCR